MTRHTSPANPVLSAPKRRPWLTLKNIFILWLVGQIIELNRTIDSMGESTQSSLRAAARNNTLTIAYDHPSLIGPWGGSWIFRGIVLLIVLLAIVRWIIRRRSNNNA
jgi:hypothetical protein